MLSYVIGKKGNVVALRHNYLSFRYIRRFRVDHDVSYNIKQNAYSKSPTRHLITHHTVRSHRSLTKLIIINHHWPRNTWEHIFLTPIWTNFFTYGNLEIVIKTEPWHHRRKPNTPSKSKFYVNIICRRLRSVLWKFWSPEVDSALG